MNTRLSSLCVHHAQVEEAISCYQRLHLATALESKENKLGLHGARRAAIAQLAAALNCRIQVQTYAMPEVVVLQICCCKSV